MEKDSDNSPSPSEIVETMIKNLGTTPEKDSDNFSNPSEIVVPMVGATPEMKYLLFCESTWKKLRSIGGCEDFSDEELEEAKKTGVIKKYTLRGKTVCMMLEQYAPVLHSPYTLEPSKSFYTVPETAKILRVHPDTIRRAIKRKVIKAIKMGSAVRISCNEIESLKKISISSLRKKKVDGKKKAAKKKDTRLWTKK